MRELAMLSYQNTPWVQNRCELLHRFVGILAAEGVDAMH